MAIFDFYKLKQIEALSSVLDPTNEYVYRKICRWYSTTFHTPLTDVLSLSLDHVITHYYEHIYENIEQHQAYDALVELVSPELHEEFDKIEEEYAESLIAEQQETLRKKESRSQDVPEDHQETKPAPTINPINMTFDDNL